LGKTNGDYNARVSDACLRDLSDIAGTWQEDENFDRALAEQDQVDESMWESPAPQPLP
jgi:hypothetical protein